MVLGCRGRHLKKGVSGVRVQRETPAEGQGCETPAEGCIRV